MALGAHAREDLIFKTVANDLRMSLRAIGSTDLPELQPRCLNMQHLPGGVEPDVPRQRLRVQDRLRVTSQDSAPVARDPRVLPGERRRHPGPALRIG